LDGKTRDEAAQQLGISLDSLRGRLERGRSLLRKRLARRGLTLSAALMATMLGESVARAALPATFVVSSTKAALLFAAGQPVPVGAAGGTACALAQGVLRSMLFTKLKLATAALLCAGMLVMAVGGWFTSSS